MAIECPFDLHRTSWTTTELLKANLLLVHGIGEHAGRYEWFASFFNQHGISVYAFDLPGHGKSAGKRGHIPSFDGLNDCIDAALEEMKAASPGVPVFLYGHSLGGLIVLNYNFRRNGAHIPVIASAPALKNTLVIPPLKLAAAKLLARLAPSFQFPSDLDVTRLSRDKAVIDAYQRDPLVHGLASAYLAINSFRIGDEIRQNEKTSAAPLLVIQGDHDGLIDVKEVIAFTERLKGDVTLKVWQGLYHEPHNEPEKLEVMQYTLNWMVNHL